MQGGFWTGWNTTCPKEVFTTIFTYSASSFSLSAFMRQEKERSSMHVMTVLSPRILPTIMDCIRWSLLIIIRQAEAEVTSTEPISTAMSTSEQTWVISSAKCQANSSQWMDEWSAFCLCGPPPAPSKLCRAPQVAPSIVMLPAKLRQHWLSELATKKNTCCGKELMSSLASQTKLN